MQAHVSEPLQGVACTAGSRTAQEELADCVHKRNKSIRMNWGQQFRPEHIEQAKRWCVAPEPRERGAVAGRTRLAGPSGRGGPGPYDFFQPIDDLRRRHPIRVHDNAVGLPRKPAYFACLIPLIPLTLLSQDLIEGNLLTPVKQIVVPAESPFLLAGGEEDLALGPWKHDRRLVPPLSDDVFPGRETPLQLDQVRSHARMVRREHGLRCDREGANLLRHILPVKEDTSFADLDLSLPGNRQQGLLVLKLDPCLNGGERDRPIHGSRIEKPVPETAGKLSGGAALARASRAVNGDDHFFG